MKPGLYRNIRYEATESEAMNLRKSVEIWLRLVKGRRGGGKGYMKYLYFIYNYNR